MWDRRAKYIGNYDGDTVKMVLDQGFNDTKIVDIRLMGVFAPEKHEEGGIQVTNFVTFWFEERMWNITWPFVVTTARMKVADREQKTLDRYVATVTSIDGTDNLNLEVMEFIRKMNYGGGVGS